MSDAAVTGIIEMTQCDPDFDAIFSNLFGIGECKFHTGKYRNIEDINECVLLLCSSPYDLNC